MDMTKFQDFGVHPGALMQLTAMKGSVEVPIDSANSQRADEKANNWALHINAMDLDANRSHVFVAKPMEEEMLLKQPNCPISVSRRIATAAGLEKGRQVLVSAADETSCYASHVEIVFRDQYLARADMWRLVSNELANHCIFRGQRIVFMGTIKAFIKTIFIRGRKVQSAFFHASTKPIFRSESARYVLFIQMSKEMWDFDAEGTGEIMFDKVINGFLPELFKRWERLKVKHLISIVLFTRMIYEEQPIIGLNGLNEYNYGLGEQSRHYDKVSKDFYRVVVSDMASGAWADILTQLKREFKTFLRDISLRKPDARDHLPLGSGLSSALSDVPSHVIAGRPSVATSGNVLEAINLASSQFSSDYIDRDLVRTGVSIVILTPSVGLFEVDYRLLVATTENLIDNGVGIDLVCLSKMPLHSVPLFRYKTPQPESRDQTLARENDRQGDENTPTGSFVGGVSHDKPGALSLAKELPRQGIRKSNGFSSRTWSYGIPHWVDISFWASSLDEGFKGPVGLGKARNKSSFDAPQHKTFIPRVKMYELQMMGVMENAISDISIPPQTQTRGSFAGLLTPTSTNMRAPSRSFFVRPSFEAFNSIDGGSSGHTPKLSTSERSSRSGNQGGIGANFQWMDEYDDVLFRQSSVASRRARRAKPLKRHPSKESQLPSFLESSAGGRQQSSIGSKRSDDEASFLGNATVERRASSAKLDRRAKTTGVEASNKILRPSTDFTARQISFGPRGFGVAAPKAVASTTITHAANIEGPKSLLGQSLKSQFPVKESNIPLNLQTNAQRSKGLSSSVPRGGAHNGQEALRPSDAEYPQSSRPIPIRNTTAVRVVGDSGRMDTAARNAHENSAGVHLHNRLAALQDLREYEQTASGSDNESDNDVQLLPAALSPSTTLAPWLTMLNPSNPSKTKKALASRLGRWQHIFPRPLPTSQIKWKSLCSPAAVPLTTEEFPSTEQLSEEYQESVYEIALPVNMDMSERPRSLVSEMLAFRLSRGFQVVVGPRIAETTKTPSWQTVNVFSEHLLEESGATIFLVRGSTIHQLTRLDTSNVEVKQLVRYSVVIDKKVEAESMLYEPSIRSTLADDYEAQQISIAPQRGTFDWKMIDSFIAGHERLQAKDFIENLRPWRTRFVLIPVDQPSSVRRPLHSINEDNEEEIRLEGIRKLTQVWQRFRYVPPEERRFQAPLRNRKDTNPLDILYQTRNPSAIVAAELETVVEGDVTGRPVQLLPESDLYQRSNLNIAALAETIQSDKGVHMLDRRWHLRLHYNCFIGFELTSWLLQNFRDVDTRDEAVELGNELMKSGMFQHVAQRHNFRDGNYFYQIAGEYRAPRPESRSWFGRGKASVPSTPVSEEPSIVLPTSSRSRSSSASDSNSTIDPTNPTGKRKNLGVALSKSLLYDVDHRGRSYRPELINLHYDRLHNPDNCYHIRVEWMNTTPKLIQDAVVSWATSVDRFGLRLVEVPLGEASSVTSMHPFRAPYLVKLTHQPPAQQPQTYFADTTSFIPQPRTEKHFYQKALMKRFSFVLDFEAASDFPADVDVTYSWGKPDYRYAQYIHRSGTVIAQITDDGDFLLLANRLYNNRSAANVSSQESIRSENPNDSRPDRLFRSSPHRGNTNPQRSSPGSSPYSSPSVRATLDVPPTFASTNASRGPSPATTAGNPAGFTRSGAAMAFATHEAIKQDFEAFCRDKEVLEAFYTEALSKSSTPDPATPFMGSKSPSKRPQTPLNESSIPSLALPGSLVSKDKKVEYGGKKPELKTRVVGGGSPNNGGGARGGDA